MYDYINAYVDEELSTTDHSAIQKHLEVCAHCANEKFQIEQIGNTIHNQFSYSAPYGLKENIRHTITGLADSDINLSNVAKRRFAWRWTYYVIPPVVTAVAAVLLIFSMMPTQDEVMMHNMMEQEIVSAHVRSLMEDNLLHVESKGPQEVKPWFNNRVDFAAQPEDLAADGFSLKGGRLDYLNKHTAASLVYESDDHIINLFVFPTMEADMKSFKNFQNRGYNIVKWVNKGLEYCAISDISLDELNKFARVYRKKITSPN